MCCVWEVGKRVKKPAEVIDADNPNLDHEHTKQRLIQAAIDQISKKHGKEAVMWLGRESRAHVEVVSTGSLNLDLALGVGGLPKVKLSMRSFCSWRVCLYSLFMYVGFLRLLNIFTFLR